MIGKNSTNIGAHVMKISEVPQDDIKILQGRKKALYALDNAGRYVLTTTQGWKTEEIALNTVIEDFEAKAEDAASRVKKQETSPLEYFMFKKWMDSRTLARAMGLSHWRVRRHFRPRVFRKIDERILAQYARLFGVAAETLKNYSGKD